MNKHERIEVWQDVRNHVKWDWWEVLALVILVTVTFAAFVLTLCLDPPFEEE